MPYRSGQAFKFSQITRPDQQRHKAASRMGADHRHSPKRRQRQNLVCFRVPELFEFGLRKSAYASLNCPAGPRLIVENRPNFKVAKPNLGLTPKALEMHATKHLLFAQKSPNRLPKFFVEADAERIECLAEKSVFDVSSPRR